MKPALGWAIAIALVANYHGLTIAQAELYIRDVFVAVPDDDKRFLLHAANYWDICRSDFLEFVREQQNGYPMIDYELNTPSDLDEQWDRLSAVEQEKYTTRMGSIFDRFMADLLNKSVEK